MAIVSSASILVQPITGELSAEGRLLRADPQLQSMQFAAGGEESGVLAVPGLLEIVMLTARLKMALSRPVIVADVEECNEVWVETRWQDDVVYLSILSRRPVDIPDDDDLHREVEIDTLSGYFSALLDADSLLISLEGAFPHAADRQFIGRPVEGMLGLDAAQRKALNDGISSEQAFQLDNVTVKDRPDEYMLKARPLYRETGNLAGYRLSFSPAQPADWAEDSSARRSDHGRILFGRELAPVLRQPLGRIIANAETIGVKLQGPLRDNYAVYARDIANAAKHLVALVDDLGDLEAVEQPDFETAPDKIELGDVAHRVAGLLALKAADHQIEIILPGDGEKVPAVAEFRRVLQILLNLVTNAIRYSPDGSKVQIDIAKLDDTACITISDEGNGVAEEDREKIFGKFERLGRSGDGGSGLGLYISRKLARAMGGDLTVSQARGGGAIFALTLPAG